MKLHLGCGKRDFGSDWTSIDGGDFPYLHSHDVTKLPFGDNSADIIYASHVLEYFDRAEVVLVLEEWFRVLKQGGTLRLAVPDFEQMVRLYFSRMFSLDNFLGPLYGKMQMGDGTIYHKTCYDFVSLKNLLEKIGFKNIRLWDWRNTEHSQHDDCSRAYIPKMDFENGTLISLNTECEK